jgi:hypothetical protein
VLIRGLLLARLFNRPLRVRGDVEVFGTTLVEHESDCEKDDDDEPKQSAFHGSNRAAGTRGNPARWGRRCRSKRRGSRSSFLVGRMGTRLRGSTRYAGDRPFASSPKEERDHRSATDRRDDRQRHQRVAKCSRNHDRRSIEPKPNPKRLRSLFWRPVPHNRGKGWRSTFLTALLIRVVLRKATWLTVRW